MFIHRFYKLQKTSIIKRFITSFFYNIVKKKETLKMLPFAEFANYTETVLYVTSKTRKENIKIPK